MVELRYLTANGDEALKRNVRTRFGNTMKSPERSSRPASERSVRSKRKGWPSVLPSPPPKLSEDEEELYACHDFTELEYRQIEQLRQQPVSTPEVRKRIADHDEIERRLAGTPEEMLRGAFQAIDHGTSTLLKLIRSRRMHHTLMPTEKGEVAGVKPHSWDGSFRCLVSRLDYLNRQLIRLAEIGVPDARSSLFYQAKMLTAAFIRLAQAFPQDFRSAAESSLTMPSLRARNPAFSADAQAIAARIHLAKKHPAADVTDNRERLGALCHVLIAGFVDSVECDRRNYQHDFETYEMLRNFRETADEYRTISFEQWLRGRHYPTRFRPLLVSAGLPQLKDDPNEWWKRRILPLVKEEFARMVKQRLHNAALWEELAAKTPKHTPAAMRRLMEKNCRNKLLQIAKACP